MPIEDDWFATEDMGVPAADERLELEHWTEPEEPPTRTDVELDDRRPLFIGAGIVAVIILIVAGILITRAISGSGEDGTATTATTTETVAPTPPPPAATTPPAAPPPATPPTPDATLPSDVTLRPGDTGDGVQALQETLADLGYEPGPIDGDYGPATAQAVTAFQQAAGLTADGIAGPETLAALAEAPPSPAPATGTELPTDVTLRLGDSGEAVQALQEALTSLGYEPGPADGDYGPATQQAVTAFQQASEITADGVAAPQTLAALAEALTRG